MGFGTFVAPVRSAVHRSTGAASLSAAGLVLVAVSFAIVAPSTWAQFTTPSSSAADTNGNFTSTIPIRLPPTTGGLAPNLAIAYDSHNGNGPVGVGWGLSGLSAITRCPRTMAQDGVRGAVNYNTSDRFCLDGSRLIAITGGASGYGANGTQYRTEIESFAQMTSYSASGSNEPTYFTVQTKNGLTKTYGTATAAVFAQGSTSMHRLWALSKVADSAGNNYSFTYSIDSANGAYYVTSISFTANVSSAAQNAVNFTYQSRPDAITTWTNGSMVKILQRLSQIKVTTSSGQEVREYRLAYDNNGSGGNSRLTSVQECASSTGPCLPSTAIGWSGGAASAGFVPQPSFISSVLTSCGALTPGDFNGDGKLDQTCSTASGQQYVIFSNGNGSFSVSAPWPATGSFCRSSTTGSILYYGDFNGDGKQDLICYNPSGTVAVAFSNGDGTFTIAPSWPSSGTFCANGGIQVADFNGDGRQDLLCSTASGLQVALSNGDGTFTAAPQWSYSLCTTNGDMRFGDFNGDGLQDLAFSCLNGSTYEYWVLFSNGNGTFSLGPGESAGAWSDASKTLSCQYFEVGDFNGDGRDDILCPAGTTGKTAVAFSKGDGTFTLAPGGAWPASGTWCMPSISNRADTVLIADFNGDGKQDMACVNTDSSTANNQFMVAYSNGDGTFSSPGVWLPTAGSPCYGQYYSSPWFSVDLDGNGSADLVCLTAALNGLASVQSQSAPDLVISLNNGLAQIVSASYQPLTNTAVYTRDTGSNAAVFPTVDVQAAFYVVSSLSVANGVGGNAATNYTYGGLKIDTTGRGSLGFRWRSVTDAQTSITSTTTYLQPFPFTGQASTLTRTVSGGGNAGTLLTTTNTPGCTGYSTSSGCAVTIGAHYFPYISQTVTSTWDLNGAAYPTQTSTYTYGDTYGASTNNYGNLAQIVTQTSDGFVKTTNNYYNNDTTHWWIGQLTKSQVTSTTP